MSPELKRPRGRPKTENPRGNGRPVRIGSDFHKMLTHIATHRDRELGWVLEDLARPAVQREYARVISELKGGP